MSHSPIRRYLKHGMLPQLTVFEAVARLSSFTRAAEELYMAQPTVSTLIKKLTETVGVPLFEQVGKRIHLTDAGRSLYAASTEIFDTLSRTERAMADLRGVHSGTRIKEPVRGATINAPRNIGALLDHPQATVVRSHVPIAALGIDDGLADTDAG